ncbi:MAG: symmetrical bis(5'-nucleosyl)-tetraphosphatase [Gammaproteobacteria bacterium]|nr:symmetrical bis(5'-nucleosyl)-tetraphosphatase [Gammaproteobacteria bacterium]
MATYAIGDVQGCFEQLQQLLKKLEYNPDKDKLWFAGDIVNRGPQSLETLRFIKSLGDRAVTVLGNHDLHLLAIANGRGKQGKKDTIQSILDAPDRNELLDWLIQQPLMHYDETLDVCMVHAGIHPQWTIAEALDYASEVEAFLQSTKAHEFFQHMYGDKPLKWSPKLRGWDRLRFITNVFTRMRYCDINGKLSLRDKGPPGKQAPGIVPWFEVNGFKTGNTRLIFGHWSTLPDPGLENIYPLDTGCLWGGKLSALKVNKKLKKLTRIRCPEAQPIDTRHGKKKNKTISLL